MLGNTEEMTKVGEKKTPTHTSTYSKIGSEENTGTEKQEQNQGRQAHGQADMDRFRGDTDMIRGDRDMI